MPERAPVSISDTLEAMRDVDDVMIVVSATLNSDTGPLSPVLRDALATVIRLAQDKGVVARHGLDDLEERIVLAERQGGRR